VFVFTGALPTVPIGDSVRVEGKVNEFIPAGGTNLTVTEIESPRSRRCSTGNPLPAATILGTGGRLVPTEVIDNDNFADFDPAQDAIDFYESLEGMRVTVPNAQAHRPTTATPPGWSATWAPTPPA
jgi:predicted extracellular nuclease